MHLWTCVPTDFLWHSQLYLQDQHSGPLSHSWRYFCPLQAFQEVYSQIFMLTPEVPKPVTLHIWSRCVAIRLFTNNRTYITYNYRFTVLVLNTIIQLLLAPSRITFKRRPTLPQPWPKPLPWPNPKLKPSPDPIPNSNPKTSALVSVRYTALSLHSNLVHRGG